jgi:hypothetical protein
MQEVVSVAKRKKNRDSGSERGGSGEGIAEKLEIPVLVVQDQAGDS